jgi:hypothetical protein
LLGLVKERLRGTRFFGDEEVMTSVNEGFAEQDKDFFPKTLEHRYAKYTGVPKKEDESITPLFIGRF